MKKAFLYTLFTLCICTAKLLAQDTTIVDDMRVVTLPEVMVRTNFDYKALLKRIKEDTTFYKAFRNLRVLNYQSYNDIKMYDKKGNIIASLNSKTKQVRANGCRTTEVLQETTTGNFYNEQKGYNYQTAEMYAGLFFAKGKVCGEDNVVAGRQFSTGNKKGMDKHKEQLKMLFFNPGKKIPGIPFIGNKLDVYEESAHYLYNYKLELEDYKGKPCYVFSIKPKADLGFFDKDKIVVDEMTTWFDTKTLEVLARNYSLSYKAGVYDFDVNMEVVMQKVKGLTVPQVLRYNGNWNVLFKKREKAIFTATIFGVH